MGPAGRLMTFLGLGVLIYNCCRLFAVHCKFMFAVREAIYNTFIDTQMARFSEVSGTGLSQIFLA